MVFFFCFSFARRGKLHRALTTAVAGTGRAPVIAAENIVTPMLLLAFGDMNARVVCTRAHLSAIGQEGEIQP